MRFGDTDPDRSVEDGRNRREFIKQSAVASATVGALTTGATGAAAAATRHGISFNNVVDAVDDLGLDPTGNDPVNGNLKSQVDQWDSVLVEFPEGNYRFTGREIFDDGFSAVGIRGKGDVDFVVDADADHTVLLLGLPNQYTGVIDRVLVEDIDLDLTADNCASGFRIGAKEKFVIDNVEQHGRGYRPDAPETAFFNLSVKDSNGTGILRDCECLHGSDMTKYGGQYNGNAEGRIAVWIGQNNKGTIRIEDCHFEEFGNNALYCSRTPGNVQVVGGVYRNNNVASVRIAGEGSYVEDAFIEVDVSKYDGPRSQPGSAYNTRGVWIENGGNSPVTKPKGAEIRNCDVRITDADSSKAAIACQSDRVVTIKNTRVRTDYTDGWSVHGVSGSNGAEVTMQNVSITGSASDGSAVHRLDSNSTVENCCIHQTGSNRDGVRIESGKTGCVVRDSTINVTGDPTAFGSNVQTSGLSFDGTCTVPELPHRIKLDNSGYDTSADYEFTVTGELKRGEYANTGDTVDGRTASGGINGWYDTYRFSGDVTDLSLTGPATVTIDGEAVNEIRIDNRGYDQSADYEFTVTEELFRGKDVEDDTVDGDTASGAIGGWYDNYYFVGDLLAVTLDGPADVYVNGNQVDPSNY